jgi:hypothetical protein
MHADIIARATRDVAFRTELLNNPKAALRAAGFNSIPEGLEIEVREETSSRIVLVLPSIDDINIEPTTGYSQAAIAGDAMSGCLQSTCSSCVSD